MGLTVGVTNFTTLEQVAATEDEIEVEAGGDKVNKEGDPAQDGVSLDHLAFAEDRAKETERSNSCQ